MPKRDWTSLANELHFGGFLKHHQWLASLQQQTHALPLIGTHQCQEFCKVDLDLLDRCSNSRNSATFASLLRLSGTAKSLFDGRRVHNCLVISCLDQDLFLGNLLLQMYGNCGALEEARAAFAKMHKRDQFSWNFLIRAYARHSHGKEALQLFNTMEQEGSLADKFVFATILSACESQVEGKQMHARIMGSKFATDLVVGNALVTMYAKRSNLEDAWRVFDKMPERDSVSWNIMIGGYAQNGQGSYSFQVFEQMQSQGVLPNKATFVSIVSACADQTALAKAMHVHVLIMIAGFDSDGGVGTALLDMYGKCGNLEDAQRIFESMPLRNIAICNAMITIYAQHGLIHDSIQLFEQIDEEGIWPNRATFITILCECASQVAQEEGKLMHAHMVRRKLDMDVVVGNVLVNMYGKCCYLQDAQIIFDMMPERDTVTWNALIGAYVQHGKSHDAVRLFNQMQLEALIPNEVTFIMLVSACAIRATQVEGRQVHACIICSKFAQNGVVSNALLKMYGKYGSLDDAQRIFDQISEPDIVSWNSIIAVYTQHGQVEHAQHAFGLMQREGAIPDKVTFVCILSAFDSKSCLVDGKKIHACLAGSNWQSDVVVGTALISMYGKCGNVDESARIFNKMPHLNIFSWNAMIAAYVHDERGGDALQVFDQMQLEGVMQDNVTFISSLSACAGTAALAEGKRIHVRIVGSECEVDVVMGNSLISMYGKCGSMRDAHRLFDEMPERNAVSWSAMIAAYSQHGHAKDSLQLFGEMQERGVVPNSITFVCVLTACSHAGLLDEGCQFFTSMIRDYGIMPTVDHYNCMIDLLGRAGLLDEAEDLIKRMPDEPTVVSWTTLLGACRNLADFVRGERAAKQLFHLDAEDAAPYIALSNLLTAAGKEEDAGKVIDLMRDKILMPTVATGLLYSCSWDRSLEGKM